MNKPVQYLEFYRSNEKRLIKFKAKNKFILLDKDLVIKEGYNNTIIKFKFIYKPYAELIKLTIINPDNIPMKRFKKCMMFRCYNADVLKNKPRDYFEPIIQNMGYAVVFYSDIKTFDKKYIKLNDYSQYDYEAQYNYYKFGKAYKA